jgi:hypothetical protein
MNPKTTFTPEQITTVFRKHNLAQDPDITRIAIGFTNEIYQVDGYIFKVCVMKHNEPNFRKESFLYKLLQDKVPVPQVVMTDDSCTILSKPYKIYKMLPGEPAASHWHEMSYEQRKSLIFDLYGHLKIIDATPHKDYFEQLNIDPDFNWQEYICDQIMKKLAVVAKEKLLPDMLVDRTKYFVQANRHVLEDQRLCLNFWDVHFDNILVDKSFRVCGLIDFEGIDVYSADYRLMTVDIMERYPHIFVSEVMEPYAKKEDYAHLLEWYKEFYAELFDFTDIARRIDFYDLLDIVSKLPEWPKAENLHERLTDVLG